MTDDQVMSFVIRMKDEASAILAQHAAQMQGTAKAHGEAAKQADSYRDRLREATREARDFVAQMRETIASHVNLARAAGLANEHMSTTVSVGTKVARVMGVMSAGTAAAVSGTVALAVAVSAGTKAWNDYAAAMGRFDARANGVNFSQLNQMAREMGRVTSFSASDVVNSGERVGRFNRLDPETFRRTLRTSLDLSRFDGMPREDAANLLGRLLNNPIEGANEARRRFSNLTASDSYRIRQMEESGDYTGQRRLILGRVEQDVSGSADLLRPGVREGLGKLRQELGSFVDANLRGFGRLIVEGGQLGNAMNSVTNPIRGVVGWMNRLAASATDVSNRAWRSIAGDEDPLERANDRTAGFVRQRDQLLANASRSAIVAAGGRVGDDPASLAPDQRQAFDIFMRNFTGSGMMRALDSRIMELREAATALVPIRGMTGDQRTRLNATVQQWETLDPLRERQALLTAQRDRARTSVTDIEGLGPRALGVMSAEDRAALSTELNRAREVAAALDTQLRGLRTTWQAMNEEFSRNRIAASLSPAEQSFENLRRQAAEAFAGVTENNATVREALDNEEVLRTAREQWIALIENQGQAEERLAAETEMARGRVVGAIREGAAAEEEANRQLQVRQRILESLGVSAFRDPSLATARAVQEDRLNRLTLAEQERNRRAATARALSGIEDGTRDQRRLAAAGPDIEAIRRATRENEAYAVAVRRSRMPGSRARRTVSTSSWMRRAGLTTASGAGTTTPSVRTPRSDTALQHQRRSWHRGCRRRAISRPPAQTRSRP